VVNVDTGKRGEIRAVRLHVAMRPSKRRTLGRSNQPDRIYKKIERLKAGMRAKEPERLDSGASSFRPRSFPDLWLRH